MEYSPPGSLPPEFSRQEYWSGLLFPSPGDLLNPGIKPGSPVLQADALSSEPPGITSRISEAEKRIGELEDKMAKITSEEQSKVKRMKRTEDSLRDLWDNIKHYNIRIIGVPE